MVDFIVKTNFSNGEISNKFRGRSDIQAFENGLEVLENMNILSSGAITRRNGTKFVKSLQKNTRIISYEPRHDEKYIICLEEYKLIILNDQFNSIYEVETLFSENQVKKLSYSICNNSIIFCEKDTPVQILYKKDNWNFKEFDFLNFPYVFNLFDIKNEGKTNLRIGYLGAVDRGVFKEQNGERYIVVSAERDFFSSIHINSELVIQTFTLKIIKIASTKEALCTLVKGNESDLRELPFSELWKIKFFNAEKGFPSTVYYKEGRLIFAGTKDFPDHIWMSNAGDIRNFSFGENLVEESITLRLDEHYNDKIISIQSMANGLFVFTDNKLYSIISVPLINENIIVKMEEGKGARDGASKISCEFDGKTIYIPQDLNGIMYIKYDGVNKAYVTKNLAGAAEGSVMNVTEVVEDETKSSLYALTENGDIFILYSSSLGENGWSRFKTKGRVLSLCVLSKKIYLTVKRGDLFFLEVIDDNKNIDCAMEKEEFENMFAHDNEKYQNFKNFVKNFYVLNENDYFKSNDPLSLERRSIERLSVESQYTMGIPYNSIVKSLPLPFHIHRKRRIKPIKYLFLLQNTRTILIDVGQGYKNYYLESINNEFLNESDVFNKIEIKPMGRKKLGEDNLWSIRTDIPLDFTILGVSIKFKHI